MSALETLERLIMPVDSTQEILKQVDDFFIIKYCQARIWVFKIIAQTGMGNNTTARAPDTLLSSLKTA
jgi:hypothetical protein